MVSETINLKHISLKGGEKILHPKSDEFKQFVNGLSSYKAIILHGLFWQWDEFILRNVPNGVKVAWVFWGGEIYGRRDLNYTFLAPRTKKAFYLHCLKQFIKNQKGLSYSFEIPKKLFKRIDYYLTDIIEEYQYAKNYLNNGMKHLWYNYYSVEDTLGDAVNLSINGDNILLGHSGDLECNHLDAFRLLHKSLLKGKTIITPLSYGAPWVIRLIKNRGKQRYKESFSPILEFLPRNDYNVILSNCSTIIMNHYRPQALGNIITGLWLGSRIYMSNKSMQYAYLKKYGLILFSIEEDLKNDLLNHKTLLSGNDISRNREILKSIYGSKVMKEKINNLARTLDS